MSKNLFCLSGQVIMRKYQLQMFVVDLVLEYGGVNVCQQGCVNFCLYLWVLQYSRGIGDLNVWVKWVNYINIDSSYCVYQCFGL